MTTTATTPGCTNDSPVSSPGQENRNTSTSGTDAFILGLLEDSKLVGVDDIELVIAKLRTAIHLLRHLVAERQERGAL